MAHALAVKKDWLAGKQILDPLLPKLRTQFGDTHPQTVFAVKNLLVILENAGESERAQALQLEFADIAPASESPNFDAFTNTGMACTRRQR